MPSANSREFEFAPLRDLDRDGDAGISEEEDNAIEDGLVSRPAAKVTELVRVLIWAVCSATAIYTTKSLMVNHGFHYPLTIAFRSFALILTVYTVLLSISAKASSIPGGKLSRWHLRQPGGDDFLANSHWAVMIPASVAAAASLPMLLEGLLHMPSLAVIVMLFPLIYAAESLVLFICCSPSRTGDGFPLESIIIMCASAMVLYNEYRLMVPGLIWGVTGVLFIGFARASFVLGSERSGSDLAVQARLKAFHGFVIMTLIFGMIMSGIMAYFFEKVESAWALSYSTLALKVFNMVAIAGTAFTGTSVLAYSPVSFEGTGLKFSNMPIRSLELLASAGSGILLLLVAMCSSPVPYVSWIQIAAYLAATLCLAGLGQISECVLKFASSLQSTLGKTANDSRKPGRFLTASLLATFILILSGIFASLSTASINSLPLSHSTSYDRTYEPDSRFDIIVSMYLEDPVSVKLMLESIKSTTLLRALDPQVIIYTKDQNADLYDLKEKTGANTVERLDNLGREGGTYLWHIVNNWDSLAEQTMFIQAHAHNMRELIPRINDYLVRNTGMLSLGFTGVTCKCGSCGDRWNWEDKIGVVPAIYEKIYDEPCAPSEPILLSYKGQFVASARRIRGVQRRVYGGLLETITSKEGWSHNATMLSDGVEGGTTGEDSPSNPYFGFTMERLWSLVLQCATGGRVASRCPSLLSGMGRGGDVADCQCLDESNW